MNKINTNITFTNDEKEVISIIKDVILKCSPETKAYIVGGFVRDKLLGLNPNDIDIMTYPTKAENFAKLITNHLSIKDGHTIKANPEKTKNISTTKVYLPLSSGKIEEIDIAQARKDVYDENSRNPSTNLVTPEEDASRRDLTINAIMFDIKDEKIVDFTGKGITDLITNTIRTPLDPLKTFSDDPLRIFRCIRFAAKYNGTIDPQTLEALKNPDLIEKIKTKISKDRIGKEILKIAGDKNANIAFEILKDTGLMDNIILDAVKGTKYEGKMSNVEMNQNNPNHQLTLWGHTMQVVTNILSKYQDAEEEKKISMVLAALFHDLGKLYSEIRGESKSHPGHTLYHGHEDESAEISKLILKYMGLDHYIQEVSNLTKNHMTLHTFTRDDSSEKALRRFIRKMGEESLNWLDVLNLSVADAYSKDRSVSKEVVDTYRDLENRLQQALISLSPSSEAKIEPVLNGNEIMQILNIKPGAYMKEITEFVKDLKDENPNITKEEAAQKIREKFSHLSNPTNPTNPTNPNEIKKSSGNDKEKKTSFCSRQLLKQKHEDIKQLIDNNKLYEANVTMKQLKDEWGKDDFVARLIAINTLNVLIRVQTLKDVDILDYLFNLAMNKYLFDYILISYVIGILILIKTGTDEESIIKIGEKIAKLSPGTLKTVLDSLPEEKIYHKNVYKKLKEILC